MGNDAVAKSIGMMYLFDRLVRFILAKLSGYLVEWDMATKPIAVSYYV